jgi:hypothetical protein
LLNVKDGQIICEKETGGSIPLKNEKPFSIICNDWLK